LWARSENTEMSMRVTQRGTTIDFSEGQQLNEQDLICTDSGPVSNSIAEIGNNKKIWNREHQPVEEQSKS
jgi:hypothetical protein